MFSLKSIGKIRYILITSAVITLLVLIFFHQPLFLKTEIKATEYPFPATGFVLFHQLVKGEYSKISFSSYNDNKELNSIQVISTNNSTEAQYNFYAHDFMEGQLSLFDINGDDMAEIIYLYKRNDSLFMSIINHKEKKFLIEDDYILKRPKGIIFGKNWDLFMRIGGVINVKGNPCIIFSVWAGYSILPRGIYSYNISTKKLRKFEFGSAVTALTTRKLNDGNTQIIATAAAPGNTWRLQQKPEFDDFNSWFFILEPDLSPIKIHKIEGEFSGTNLLIDNKKNIYGHYLIPRKEQAIFKIGTSGEFEKFEKIMSLVDYKPIVANTIGQSIIFSGLDTITFFDSNLKPSKRIINKNFNRGHLVLLRESDLGEEYYLYCDFNKILLLDKSGKIIKSLNRRYAGNTTSSNPTSAIIGSNHYKVFENSFSSYWEYEIKIQNQYQLAPFYIIGLFIGLVGTLLFIKVLFIKVFILVAFLLSSTRRSEDYIFILSSAGKLIFMNKTAEYLLGIRASYWFGTSVPIGFKEIHTDLFVLFLECPRRYETTVEILSMQIDEKYAKYKCTVTPLKGPGGLILAHFLRLENLSEQINAERRKVLLHSIQKVAHEIKTPLASILLNLDTIEERLDSSAVQVGSELNIARQEIYRIRNFINKFLKLSDSNTPILSSIPAESLINNALLRFTAYTAHKIKIEVSGDIVIQVICDGSRIEDALQIFIENAIDALNGSGKITINCEKKYSDGKRYLEFMISDEGSGIEDRVRNSLFDPYTTTKPHGSGMGLAIAKKILEDHDSKISVKPNKPNGTIIAFRLLAFE